MEAGFIVNPADVTGITTAYDLTKVIEVRVTATGDANHDSRTRQPPQGCGWSDLELQLDVTAGLPTSVQAKVYYDATCDDLFAGESTVTGLTPGMTDTSRRGCTITFEDVQPVPPTSQTTPGTFYVLLRVNVGTVTCELARMHWHNRRGA
ncbi:MAG: hypothetical protein ABIJ75_10245 [Actinomycetota bacterium]